MKRLEKWQRTIAVIISGQAFSLIGSGAVQFAIIWWITTTTGSAVSLTIASIIGLLPQALIGPFAGVFIDRHSRKAIMIAADGLVALSSAALALVFWVNEAPSLYYVYAALLLRALGGTFHSPAMQASVPLLAPADALTKVGGWTQMISSASMMLAPALGAAMMAGTNMPAILMVDVLGAALAIGALMMVKVPNPPAKAEHEHVLTELRGGLRALLDCKPLWRVTGPVLLSSLFYMPLGTLYPLLVSVHYMGGAWHNSAVEIAFAAGMMVASAALGVWGDGKRPFLLMSIAIAALGALSIASGLFPPALFWLFALCTLGMGATGSIFSIPYISYMQRVIAPEMLGKVYTLSLSAMSLASPLGLILAGPVSEAIGVDRWFIWSGAALLLVGAYCWTSMRRYEGA